jgi:hypothetical protein
MHICTRSVSKTVFSTGGASGFTESREHGGHDVVRPPKHGSRFNEDLMCAWLNLSRL